MLPWEGFGELGSPYPRTELVLSTCNMDFKRQG